jgi:cytochrome d ubiquinol oxidase subunit II
MKTDGVTQAWARKCAAYVLGYVGLFLGIVSVSMPMMNAGVKALWFSVPNFFYLLPIPLLTACFFMLIWRDLHRGREYRPFFLSIGVFMTGYLGLGISLWPWLVPFAFTFRQAAAAASSQSLLLIGTAIMLPVVLAYTAFCYYLFRGKASHEGYY